jgi:5-methylcytosine-specific restriction endonuclease McrA
MADDPESIRAYRRDWTKTKKGILANRAARTARRGSPYTPDAKEWIASLKDPACIYCGRFATEIDHLIPISRGGTGELSNLAPACRNCNSRKNDMTYSEFLSLRG